MENHRQTFITSYNISSITFDIPVVRQVEKARRLSDWLT